MNSYQKQFLNQHLYIDNHQQLVSFKGGLSDHLLRLSAEPEENMEDSMILYSFLHPELAFVRLSDSYEERKAIAQLWNDLSFEEPLVAWSFGFDVPIYKEEFEDLFETEEEKRYVMERAFALLKEQGGVDPVVAVLHLEELEEEDGTWFTTSAHLHVVTLIPNGEETKAQQIKLQLLGEEWYPLYDIRNGFTSYLLRCKAPQSENAHDSCVVIRPDGSVGVDWLSDDWYSRMQLMNEWNSLIPEGQFGGRILDCDTYLNPEQFKEAIGGAKGLLQVAMEVMVMILQQSPKEVPFVAVWHLNQLNEKDGTLYQRPPHLHIVTYIPEGE